MPPRTAILHIGTGKTGTTSIQRALGQNRETLRDKGFAYPESPGHVSHTKLAVFLQECAGAGPGRMQLRAGPTSLFMKSLQEEIGALPATVHTVIFSSEHLFSRAMEPGVLPQLRAMLATMFDRFRIVVYLRRQDELAISRLSTRLKAGRAPTAVFPTGERTRSGYDYAAGLGPWVEAFGQEAITARIFARSEMAGGDVVRDFLDVCGLPELPPAPVEANTSLLPHAQEFLRLINLPAEPDSDTTETTSTARKPPRNWRPPSYFRSFLTTQFGGRGALPSRAEAMAFFASFAESNERVRTTFFPQRNRLFEEDFGRYPENPAPPSDAAVLGVALAVTRLQSTMIAELRATRAVERAREALAAGDRGSMVKAYLKALEYQPAHKSALRELAAAVETHDEALSVRQFLATAPISVKRKAAVETELQERFGGQALASKREVSAQARAATRQAMRQAKRSGQKMPPPPPGRTMPALGLTA